MAAESSDKNFIELMKQGWIAGYPPWFHKFWTQHAKCKTEEKTSHLLHLLRSIEDGKPEETRRLLPGIDLNLRLALRDQQTESLLEWAAENARHPECIRLLLAAGASVKAPMLVYKLVSARQTELLGELLRAGADPNAGPRGEPALAAACWMEPKIVRLLLAAGARTDATTTLFITNKRRVNKVTPLMSAAYVGQLPIVKLLLEAGADVNAVDSEGNTAVAWAKISRAKAKAAKIIPLLEQAGATAAPNAGSLPEPVDFSARAKTPEFRKALALAKALTKSAGKSVELEEGPLAGVRAFHIRDRESALDLLDKIRPEITALGAFAFISEDLGEMNGPSLVLVPTAGYRDALIAFETPVGQSIDSYTLVAWLAKLEKTQPFVVTNLAPDRLQARFTTAIQNPMALAKAIEKICPDVINEPLAAAAGRLEKSRELYLWWD